MVDISTSPQRQSLLLLKSLKPASPVIVSTLDSGGSDVLIKGNYAYLLSGGVKVIDISNKVAPRLVTTVKLPGQILPGGEQLTETISTLDWKPITDWISSISAPQQLPR